MSKYIISDPTIVSGMPIIKGTCVPVARILSLFKERYTLDEIHEQFDHIKALKTPYEWALFHKTSRKSFALLYLQYISL